MEKINNLLARCNSLKEKYYKKHEELDIMLEKYNNISGNNEQEKQFIDKIKQIIQNTKENIITNDQLNEIRYKQIIK